MDGADERRGREIHHQPEVKQQALEEREDKHIASIKENQRKNHKRQKKTIK
jgi:hypothetical protein